MHSEGIQGVDADTEQDDRAAALSQALRWMGHNEVFEAQTATGSTYHVVRHPDGGYEITGGRSLRGWERAEIVGAVSDSSGYARLAVVRTDPGPDDKTMTTSPVQHWRLLPRALAG